MAAIEESCGDQLAVFYRNRAPDEYKERIERFRNRWPGNRIGEVAEPHITVKDQGGPTEDLAWLDKREAPLAPYPSFPVTFVRVYKEVEPDQYIPFEDIRLA